MLSGFVSWQGLVNGMIVHSEMPGEKSSAIMTASEPFIHGERVIQCVGATRRIVGRMNSDKCRPHRPMQGPSAISWGDDVLRDFQFACTGGRRAADGGASGSHRTGRKEKPHQDNGKKPKCAKFHRNRCCRCERKAIEGCTATIVPSPSAFRKRNRCGLQTSQRRQRRPAWPPWPPAYLAVEPERGPARLRRLLRHSHGSIRHNH